jgi:catechol 2,3-dioxygenase-like lactoylglutathione lyase family enzyme
MITVNLHASSVEIYMKTGQALATIAVSDFAVSSAWYARLFGRTPDQRPNVACAEWQIAHGAAIQLLHKSACLDDKNRSDWASIGIIVDDLDDVLNEMRERQIDVAPPQTATHFMRFAPVTDPDGNMVTFVESIAR